MKRILCFMLAVLMLAGLLTGCGDELKIFTDVDFASSPFKHLNNGGITDSDTLPYNVDAITGATLTVEGPGVVTSTPLSVRELESRSDGLVRGEYKDSNGKMVYEGLDLYYLLNDMVEGDNGIILTDSAYKVILKNSNRESISEFTLDEVKRAHDDNRPILLAYGVATDDQKTVAPFVFDAKSEGEHSLGYVDELGNDDGCIKLVYDRREYGDNKYRTFSNVAYVYVCEESEPGFKHSGCAADSFGASKYTDYIVTFRGSKLGYEIPMTVKQLESLVVYDRKGNVKQGGIGYSDWYSLANNAYWYVNQYEGLDLYKLLIYLGMDDAETMGIKEARTTLVSFIAADGAAANETFSVDTLSYPDAFGFYNKNAADLNDGSYVPTNADLVKTGYPVLLSYGVNNYPYTISKTDPNYLSGLSNSGGPLRVVFGKTQYNHANGSNQVQYLSDIIVGENVLYNTHKHTDNAAQKALADSKLSLVVNNEDGKKLINKTVTVGDIEDIVYGEGVGGDVKKAAKVKDSYEVKTRDGYTTDIYEGINLEYFLMNVAGLPGTNGTVTFSNGKDKLTVTLEELFRSGYNAELKRDGLCSVIAFAKNGAPMVQSSKSDGYVDKIELNPMLRSDPDEFAVENYGGPLSVIIPGSGTEKSDTKSISNVTSITVNLIPDSYAHINKPYSSYEKDTVRFYGEGLDKEKTYTVKELESKQTKTKTLDFSMLNKAGKSYEARYRGLSLYDLFTEIGIKNNAGDVIVYSADGSRQTFSLALMKKAYDNMLSPEKTEVRAMLAYGTAPLKNELMDGTPLVASSSGEGYVEADNNDGGPLKLIVPQDEKTTANASMCVKNVVAVEVTANKIETWGHKMSDVYGEFLDSRFTFTVRNDSGEWTHDFTLEQLESLSGIIVRDKYSVLDVGTCEGLDIWKFIQLIAGDVKGIDNPVSVTAYASDGYKNDLLSVFYRDGFINGVADENGDSKKLILCYAINGYPLVDSEGHEGYTGLAGNTAGPIRVIAETNQGASVKYCNKLVVTVSGSDKIDIKVDNSIFK